ncbi:winged helix-turn-helix transcriptional regulator [Umezawaea sp. NPDC059074]|uniref:winged helix-turn-helix transcriptional regulator n=1 Tax=Umezawaea sp. NPDC059074 TaxID=3346716 RepID=UPI0036783A9C
MTREPSIYLQNCPSRAVIGVIASHWGTLVLGTLFDGTLRYTEIRRSIEGISEKMLAQTLQSLERSGFVVRRVHPVIPPHVDYTLTPMGMQVASQARGLLDWVTANMGDIVEAQHAYDAGRAETRG